MVNLDLSKALHPRFVESLVALLPGFFFETCLLMADPQGIRTLSERVGLDRYSLALVALVIAFVVGSGAMVFVRVIQTSIVKVYLLISGWWPGFLERMVAFSGRHAPSVQSGLPAPSIPWWIRAIRWLWRKEIERRTTQGWVQEAWMKVVAAVLRRYGVKDPGKHSEAWMGVVGRWRPEHVRGDLVMIATHACGWVGLVARHFAPLLRLAPFTGFFLFLIVTGLLHDCSVAWHGAGQVSSWYIGLSSALGELKTCSSFERQNESQRRAAAAEPDGDVD